MMSLSDVFDATKNKSIDYNVLTEAIVKITSTLTARHQSGMYLFNSIYAMNLLDS